MNTKELKEILKKHLMWLEDEECGECANLEYANLEYANLEYANLEYANLKGANLECANLEYANLEYANLECANLECANLKCANLKCANLKCAILDFSCLPLWCGSFGLIGDDRLIAQLVAHITRITVNKPNKRTKAIMKLLKEYADEFCEYRTDVKKLDDKDNGKKE